MISDTCRDNLLSVATAYALARNLSLTTVANEFYGSRNFFKEFDAGERSISLTKYDQMMQKFSDSWPPDTQWPRLRSIKCDRPVVSHPPPPEKKAKAAKQSKQGKTHGKDRTGLGTRGANRLSHEA